MSPVTTFLFCPADSTVLVPSYDQPFPAKLNLRCTNCAFHILVSRSSGQQGEFALVELEAALTSVRQEFQTSRNGRDHILGMQISALSDAVRRLDSESPALVGLELPMQFIIQHFADS